MQKTWVQSLHKEDSLEKEMATHSNVLAGRIPWTKEPQGVQLWGRKELETTDWLTLSTETVYDYFNP